jgi:hypothetical protein
VDVDDYRALPSLGSSMGADAELHVALADDRDAAAEARQLAALVDRAGPLRVVELFAGGGYHGRALAAAGHETHYVDSSARMRRLMTERFGVPAQRYHLATLPDWPDAATPPFDLAVLARFGADYLAPAQLDDLATRLAVVLGPGGVWSVELQDRRSVDRGHRDLAIRVREATVGGRHAVLEFPDAEILVQPAEGDRPPVLWQSLTLTVSGPDGTRSTRYAHWEYLYDRPTLLALPAVARHFEALDVDLSAVFPQSTVVALRRR